MTKPVANDAPAAPHSFVGRDDDLHRLGQALTGSRLVTVSGPPGVGKTRLAREVAREVAGDFPAGVCFVALAPVQQGSLVAVAVAAELSIAGDGRDPSESVVAAIGERRMIIVLDNCEHVRIEVATFVDLALRSCPGLVVLATSQEPLGISGETVVVLAPLEVPPEGAPTALLHRYDSVQLFCARAAGAVPSFSLSDHNAAAVGTICRRLDGIPLALELAASLAAVLAPADIARHLGERLDVLAAPATVAGADPRHSTLRRALSWSFGLLSGTEQAVLRRMSVFSGGADSAAIEAVCAGLAPSDVGDVIDALVRKSLVVADTAVVPTRYRLLETVRQFASERLDEAGETDGVAEAHARWFASWAQSAEPHFTAADQLEWFDRAQGEIDNLRLALAWAWQRRDAEKGLAIAGALVIFWRIRGPYSEALRWLSTFLDLSSRRTAKALTAKALWGQGFMLGMLSRITESRASLEKAAALFEAAGDHRGWGRALMLVGNAEVVQNIPTARATLLRAVQLADSANDAWCVSHALSLAALAQMRQGSIPDAESLAARAVDVARRAGEPQGLRWALSEQGTIAWRRNFPLAKEALTECVEVARSLGDTYTTALALVTLGRAHTFTGRHDEAHPYLEQGLVLARGSGNPDILAGALTALGNLALSEGDFKRAAEYFTQCTGDHPVTVVGAALGLAHVDFESGDLDSARRRCQAALRTARRLHDRDGESSALYWLGVIAKERGVPRAATAYLRQALGMQAKAGDLLLGTFTLVALGSVAAISRRVERAARLLGAAEALRERLGLQDGYVFAIANSLLPEEVRNSDRWAKAFEEGSLLSAEDAFAYATRGGTTPQSAGGAQPATGDEPVTGGWQSLTLVERQIAGLVAQGLSNPKIGQRLFISSSTVHAHLVRIFPKLGIASRSELAVIADRQSAQQTSE